MNQVLVNFSLAMMCLGAGCMYIMFGFVWWERFFERYYGKVKVKDILCILIFLPHSVIILVYTILKRILNKEINLR